MARRAPADPAAPARWTTEQFLRLVEQGVLGPDDDVELLEGVVVAVAPSNVAHGGTLGLVSEALFRAVGDRAVVRVRLSLVAGSHSLLEPDVTIVPGTPRDYERVRPTTALLVVEVSDTSLKQDRLTKGAIYAAAGIPEYWIVNLRDDVVEIRRDPSVDERRYRNVAVARRGESIEVARLPLVSVTVDALLPSPSRV